MVDLSAPVLAKLEAADKWSGVRNALRGLAADVDEYAGIPVPIDDQHMVVEPSYQFAGLFNDARQVADRGDDDGSRIRNSFYSSHRRSDIVVFEKDGRIDWGLVPAVHSLGKQMQTLGAAVAWGIEQEGRAVQLLGTLLRHHPFKTYLLTGAFLESSRRSGIVYMFRRLRPTVAISLKGAETRIIAALCLHPIAYYADSWAGAMCPTDDVIAHLMMMRADEHMFWRRANQHPAWRPEAGL